jgi:ABC-type transporter MlaC component
MILGILSFAYPSSLSATVPTDQLRGTVDRVLEIPQDKGRRSDDKRQERRDPFRNAISARFDFAEMAKRSLGAE